MKKIHFFGLALWRGGLILVLGYLAYQALRVVLKITDAHLELAVAVLLTGAFFLFLSVLLERIEDARKERRQDE
jgi:membrane protein DedA with SNARE-associated domain